MKPIPLLFLSDSPHLPTGLARICKDLAVHTASLPEFRVGVMGRGGTGSRQLPFAQYNFSVVDQWGEEFIESIWADFSGGQPGIIFTIWDPSRLHWFACPNDGMKKQYPGLLKFLQSKQFARWGYFPVDHTGINDRLTGMDRDTILGFNRVLAYSLYGKQIIERTIGQEVDWLPHGFNSKIFYPRSKESGRAILGLDEKDVVIGCVMTNQGRKDWGLAFSTFAELAKRKHHRMKFWAHVDALERAWSLPALIEDYGLGDRVRVTMSGEYSSEQLAHLYSTCNITILPSLGEGFGYPLVESMACGVPVIHGKYAAGPELIPSDSWLVEPAIYRLESPWNCLRPVFDPRDWVHAIENVLDDGDLTDVCVKAVEHLRWDYLWQSTWQKWMLDGIK